MPAKYGGNKMAKFSIVGLERKEPDVLHKMLCKEASDQKMSSHGRATEPTGTHLTPDIVIGSGRLV